MEKAKEYWSTNYPSFLEDLKSWARIPSVSIAQDGLYLFGKACADVLDCALETGRRMGFETENDDYYGGSILFRGTGFEEIGIFAHLDVVPEGEGWAHPPYDPYVVDGWMYGRGCADDKGPAVTALYVMNYLKQSGYVPKHTIRLFLGCNEECGMEDIKYFLRKHPAPAWSIVADGGFSVCYAEKGILEADFVTDMPVGMGSFVAGNASNAVAAEAEARLTSPLIPEEFEWVEGLTITKEQDGLKLHATGRTAHAAGPEGSDNAAVKLARCLLSGPWLGPEAQNKLAWIAEDLADYYGGGVGIACESAEMGKLTIVAGMTRTCDGRLVQNINIRYPAVVTGDELLDKLCRKAAERGWKLENKRDDPPSYMPPDHPYVTQLDSISRKYLGDVVKPYTMGGGTYARHLPNAAAYGPGMPGLQRPTPPGHGGGHQPDECVSLQQLEKAFYIYTEALQALDEME